MRASLSLFAFLCVAITTSAELAFDANLAKTALRALHQQYIATQDATQRIGIAKSMLTRTTPLIKAEPEGLGGWLMHAEASLELKDKATCDLAAANLLRLHAETSALPMAASVLKGLQKLGSLPAGALSTALATKDNPFINSLGMKLVPVPKTQVLMCIHETRKRDYLTYFKDSGATNDEWLTKKFGSQLMIPSDDHPVAYITWDEAKAFCSWLADKEHRKYRLCTDHEWSCAAGLADEDPSIDPLDLVGKHPSIFPWGSDYPPKRETANLADDTYLSLDPKLKSIHGYHDGYGQLAPVMSFPPNELGIHDLAGNVAEWTLSLARLGKSEKAVRGSAWSFVSETGTRSDYRAARDPNQRSFATGFRIVLELEPPTAPEVVPVAAVPAVQPPQPPPPAKPAAPVPVRERLKPQPNGDLMLVDLPTVTDAEALNDIDIFALVWMKKYHGWKADVPKIVQRHKLDLTGDYDIYSFMTGTFAKDAHVRLKASRTFDKNDAARALKRGNPILIWRYYRDEREALLRNFAQQHKSDSAAKLPDPSDADEKKKWPKYDKLLDDKGERVAMASIVYGYNDKRNEFIMLDPLFGDEYQLLWITAEELKATTYDVFIFE